MNNKFNVKWTILSCLLICSVGSSAYATGTETLSTEKESTLTHNWLDRTDIKAKFQTNHEPQYAVETLQPLGHYDEKTSKDLVFVQGSVSWFYNKCWGQHRIGADFNIIFLQHKSI